MFEFCINRKNFNFFKRKENNFVYRLTSYRLIRILGKQNASSGQPIYVQNTSSWQPFCRQLTTISQPSGIVKCRSQRSAECVRDLACPPQMGLKEQYRH